MKEKNEKVLLHKIEGLEEENQKLNIKLLELRLFLLHLQVDIKQFIESTAFKDILSEDRQTPPDDQEGH